MSVVFQTPTQVTVRTSDGRNFIILQQIVLRTDDGAAYAVPYGATSDGASTPSELWIKLPPFGPYWLAAVVHDAAYRGLLQRQRQDGSWALANLNKDQCDTLFLDCMIALGVDVLTRDTLYDGVNLFGWKAFREDRQNSS